MPLYPMGPLSLLHAEGMKDIPCAACQKRFVEGDYVTLVPLGPGDNEVQRKECREGRQFFTVCCQVHWACATGQTHIPEEEPLDVCCADKTYYPVGLFCPVCGDRLVTLVCASQDDMEDLLGRWLSIGGHVLGTCPEHNVMGEPRDDRESGDI